MHLHTLSTLDLVLLILAGVSFLVATLESRVVRRDGGAGLNLVALGLLLLVLSMLL